MAVRRRHFPKVARKTAHKAIPAGRWITAKIKRVGRRILAKIPVRSLARRPARRGRARRK